MIDHPTAGDLRLAARGGFPMNVLMVDVGGTNVKVMASYDDELRKFPSGEKAYRKRNGARGLEISEGLEFDRISSAFRD